MLLLCVALNANPAIPSDAETLDLCVQTVSDYKVVVAKQDQLILDLHDIKNKLIEANEEKQGTPWYYRGLLSVSVGALGGVALKPQDAAVGVATGGLLGLALWLLTETAK